MMRPIILLAGLLLLSGCSLDAFRSKPLQAPNGHGENFAGRPEEVTFLPGLGVNLQAMTRTASGLYWRDLVEGQGDEVTPGSVAVVHYTGWLPNGRKFDSSRDRGDPLTFTLGAGMVIAGWDEGVAGMRTGGRRQLVIPPELGYGAAGAGGTIPPNATLVFEVELVAVQGPAEPLAVPGAR
jgi:FKBP-type peptidyl-prolyl cis-trans isomerase FkpA